MFQTTVSVRKSPEMTLLCGKLVNLVNQPGRVRGAKVVLGGISNAQSWLGEIHVR